MGTACSRCDLGEPHSSALADLNGDGQLDLVTAKGYFGRCEVGAIRPTPAPPRRT